MCSLCAPTTGKYTQFGMILFMEFYLKKAVEPLTAFVVPEMAVVASKTPTVKLGVSEAEELSGERRTADRCTGLGIVKEESI